MFKSKYILLLLLLAFCFTDCKKYPEGPWISLRTKMARVTGSWGIGKYLVNGSDSTQALLSRVPCEKPIFFERPKGGNQLCLFSCLGVISIDGVWGFIDRKNKLHINSSADTSIKAAYPPIFISQKPGYINWDIIRLTNKELWLKVNYNNVEYYIELKK